jgi:hypothetical protein
LRITGGTQLHVDGGRDADVLVFDLPGDSN